MMPRKTRTYEDYLELGLQLHNVRDALLEALSSSSAIFGKSKKQTRDLLKLLSELDKTRTLIDAEYCRHPVSHNVPEGLPRYPLYMQNWLENPPVERLRLEERGDV
jgi:hypothetical protein